jgi:hypothetical protein
VSPVINPDEYNSLMNEFLNKDIYHSLQLLIIFMVHERAFDFISEGLTDYEAKALYWIVQKYQTTLGRQVY